MLMSISPMMFSQNTCRKHSYSSGDIEIEGTSRFGSRGLPFPATTRSRDGAGAFAGAADGAAARDESPDRVGVGPFRPRAPAFASLTRAREAPSRLPCDASGRSELFVFRAMRALNIDADHPRLTIAPPQPRRPSLYPSLMNLSLHGKRAVVCGSTQGIGLAAAVELAELGARITLFARNPDKLRETAQSLPRLHDQQHDFLAADFADPSAVKSAADTLAQQASASPIHILINNTGGPPGGTAIDAAPEAYLAAFTAHVIANQLLTQAVVPGMRHARYGRIVNVISTSVKAPIPNLGVSNTIRAAVASWAKTLATELAPHGITVNNVLPGYTTTARLKSLVSTKATKTNTTEDAISAELIATIPAARFGTPEELGSAIAFLCTPAAAYINGINLPVDGGRLQSL
jgi:3-oxoacyl-[acyl-carrier protein] reductase